MTTNELRVKLLAGLTNLLSRSLLVSGEARDLIAALHSHFAKAPDAELQDILSYLPDSPRWSKEGE